MNTPDSSSTTLPPHLSRVAQWIWILLSGTAVFFFLISSVATWQAPLAACTHAEVNCSPWSLGQEDVALAHELGLPVPLMLAAYYAIPFVAKVCFILIGLLIFWRKPNDWVALLMSLCLTLLTTEGLEHVGSFGPLVKVLYVISTWLYTFLPFVFPHGRFAPRWVGWLAHPLLLIINASELLPQPTGDLQLSDRIFWVIGGIVVLWLGLSLFTVVYRYTRVANVLEKQQIKWVMAGILGWSVFLVPTAVQATILPASQPSAMRLAFFNFVYLPTYVVSYLFISGAIAFAILRYRLWDIDIIIRRTVQYSLVTAVLAAVYLGSVVVLQQLFVWLTGSESAVAIVLSTLAIAALFTPLRQRVQTSVDRRFFRPRYDPAQVLATFAQTTKEETDVTQLTAELQRILQQTLQPSQAGVWLKK